MINDRIELLSFLIYKFYLIYSVTFSVQAIEYRKSRFIALNLTIYYFVRLKYGLRIWDAAIINFEIDLGNLEASAKVDGHGQAKILSDKELGRLFEEGFQSWRDRVLFGLCLFTGCRISEALQLKTEMLRGNFVTFTRETRKGKMGTQQVEIVPALRSLIEDWQRSDEMPGSGYLFRSRPDSKQPFLSRMQAHEILKLACDRIGIEGVSTHSFRRTYITKLRSKGYSPAQIQKRTGHKRRENLMHYFDQV